MDKKCQDKIKEEREIFPKAKNRKGTAGAAAGKAGKRGWQTSKTEL
jgi:hypothetical protein